MVKVNILSLFELNILVKKNLKQCLPDTYWIQAELSDVHVNAPSGHCYVEFVEKNTQNNRLVAKARGMIWANIFPLLKSCFEKETGQPFTSGIKVLVQVAIEFHELYGYSLTVYDIDPTYTLGDMARRRQEILKQLEEEGVQTLNKELLLPPVPNRIAVISSASAAGYEDFCHQLQHHSKGFFFYTELFPAIMQGNQVEKTILAALDMIYSRADEFDVVVIIRGGGAISDLSGFDTYLLAASCAQFALPIITGIGHERDDTVLDMIAHTRVKTPTAAAEFLINRMTDTAAALTHLTEQLKISVSARIEQEIRYLNLLKNRIPSLTFTYLSDAKLALLASKNDLARVVTFSLSSRKHQLDLLHQRIADASPERLLSRGYSITMKDGKVVSDVSQLSEGDLFTTRLAKGEITGTVIGVCPP
ncbi:Exodeoxyribonuclease 7 large subunit [termite gut metagenome]|uniref:Exodeoxyribonuclease 7 large subunit n=1 Tax=termite gut metagenome TaxID=433724 RepID=A0A5J4QWU6_9ZZZZ